MIFFKWEKFHHISNSLGFSLKKKDMDSPSKNLMANPKGLAKWFLKLYGINKILGLEPFVNILESLLRDSM